MQKEIINSCFEAETGDAASAASPRKVLVTGAGGFLGKYMLKELGERGCAVTTIGLDADKDDVVVDLAASAPYIDTRYDAVVHLVGSCFGDDADAERLNVHATENLLASLRSAVPGGIVYISSVEVYGRTEGTDYTEGTIPDPVSAVGRTKLEAEKILTAWGEAHGSKITILRCPPIVGTGMGGPLRKIVNSIYRATYHHIADETASMSVVHAVDVARAAADLAEMGGIYNLTDGVNPTRHDLAEAFAHRMADKRIYTLRPKRAKWAARFGDWCPGVSFDSNALAARYKSLTFSADKVIGALGWRPNPVVEYLRTHIYDESSL